VSFLDAKDVRDRVLAWAKGVMGVPVIHGWPNADAPAEPYAAVCRVMSDKVQAPPAGEDFVVENEGELNETIRQIPLAETYWRFTLDVFGPDAEDYLQKIVTAYAVPQALWPLRPLILFETSRIATMPELRDQEWKDRAQMTIEVRGVPTDGIIVDVIDEQTPEFQPV